MIAGVVLRGTSMPIFGQVVGLRCRCWGGSLPDLDLLDDGHDSHALHFVFLDHDAVIAAARLCVHDTLSDISDPHLFAETNKPLPAPLGCINRLVVHPKYRRLGIAAILDQVRTEVAKRLGCKTMLVTCNEHSGIQRRNAIQAQGFESITDDRAVADGKWGYSYPYAKSIDDDTNNKAETLLFDANLQIFADELNKLLSLIDMRRLKILSLDET